MTVTTRTAGEAVARSVVLNNTGDIISTKLSPQPEGIHLLYLYLSLMLAFISDICWIFNVFNQFFVVSHEKTCTNIGLS